MANETRRITFEWEDIEGKRKSFPLYFGSDDITDIATAQGIANDYAALLRAVSGCTIRNISIEWLLETPSLAGPVAGYRLNTGAYLTFNNGFEQKPGYYVPGASDAVMIGKVVNPDATAMAALIAASIGTGDDTPVSSPFTGAAFTSYVRGKQANRKI